MDHITYTTEEGLLSVQKKIDETIKMYELEYEMLQSHFSITGKPTMYYPSVKIPIEIVKKISDFILLSTLHGSCETVFDTKRLTPQHCNLNLSCDKNFSFKQPEDILKHKMLVVNKDNGYSKVTKPNKEPFYIYLKLGRNRLLYLAAACEWSLI